MADNLFVPHTAVAVRCRFDGTWVEGFEIADVEPEAPTPYLLRRRSDRTQLPTRFGRSDVRPVS